MALRFNSSDVPLQTSSAPQAGRGATVRRAKTLTKPERGQAPPPLINPSNNLLLPVPTAAHEPNKASYSNSPWRIFSKVITFWAPSSVLRSLAGLSDANMIQAWREKMALVFIILCMCGIVGFATVGLQQVFCPATTSQTTSTIISLGSAQSLATLAVRGVLYNISASKPTGEVNFYTLAAQMPGQDITPYFTRAASDFPACNGLSFAAATDNPCPGTTVCPLPSLSAASTYTTLGLQNISAPVGYGWDDIKNVTNYMVIDGSVLNMQPYVTLHPSSISNDLVDDAIRTVLAMDPAGGRDATRMFANSAQLKHAMPCLQQRYIAGHIDKITAGCFVSNLVLYAGLIVVLGLVLLRFVMACIFAWFLSGRLAGNPDKAALNRAAISPAVMPGGANVSIDNKTGTAPWTQPGKLTKKNKGGGQLTPSASSSTINEGAAPILSLAQIGAELFAICLVTCYSEGEDSLRTTLDSISRTDYSDARKLLFIVADGMITGAGEKRSTPDICVSLLEADPRFGNPVPMSYIAVGSGAKAENRAMVYAGHYSAYRLPCSMLYISTARRVFMYQIGLT